mmetsp:Transcript_8505/g.22803  ORF Transcript_8505/g.22803 Transcript_8505/m.22803 type:complete len:202 (+) Transcript_8505:30-635(+)
MGQSPTALPFRQAFDGAKLRRSPQHLRHHSLILSLVNRTCRVGHCDRSREGHAVQHDSCLRLCQCFQVLRAKLPSCSALLLPDFFMLIGKLATATACGVAQEMGNLGKPLVVGINMHEVLVEDFNAFHAELVHLPLERLAALGVPVEREDLAGAIQNRRRVGRLVARGSTAIDHMRTAWGREGCRGNARGSVLNDQRACLQ